MSDLSAKGPAEEPSASAAPAPEPPAGPPADSPAGAEAAARAREAWTQPVLATAFPRCPRCGERFPPEIRRGTDEEPAPLPPPCPRCAVDPLSPAAGERLTPHGSWLRELLRGATYLPRGAAHILRHPRLWKWAAVPALINVLVIFLSVFLAGLLNGWLETHTSELYFATWTGPVWRPLSYVVRMLGWFAGWASWILIPLLSVWLIVAPGISILYKILFMPFMELLAEGTEQEALGIRDDSRFDFARMYANVVVAIIDAVFLTLLQGLLFLLLLPVNIIPILGQLLWLTLPPAIFAGMDYSDIDLVRRRYTTREKARLWAHHHWRFLGYGVSFCFLITVPLVNMVIIPAAAAGGSLLYLELDRK